MFPLFSPDKYVGKVLEKQAFQLRGHASFKKLFSKFLNQYLEKILFYKLVPSFFMIINSKSEILT